MKSLMASLFLGALCATACVSAAREEASARRDIERSLWPFGTYELVSFNGQSLPVELSDGRILSGGELTLSEGIRAPWRPPSQGVEFHIWCDYPAPYGQIGNQRRWGAVSAEQEPVEGARIPLQFEALGSYGSPGGSSFRGFDQFPLEWADPKVCFRRVTRERTPSRRRREVSGVHEAVGACSPCRCHLSIRDHPCFQALLDEHQDEVER